MSDEIRDAVAFVLVRFVRVRARDAADAVLALPQIREALSLRSSLDPCPRCGTGVVSICLGCKTQQAERERDEARAALAAAQEEINHWRVKAKCYGGMVRGCSPALAAAGFPVDASGPDGGVGGVRRSVEGLTSALAAAQAENERLLGAIARWRAASFAGNDHEYQLAAEALALIIDEEQARVGRLSTPALVEQMAEALRELKGRLWREWGPGDVRSCALCGSDEDRPHRERCPIRSVDAALAAYDAQRGGKRG